MTLLEQILFDSIIFGFDDLKEKQYKISLGSFVNRKINNNILKNKGYLFPFSKCKV